MLDIINTCSFLKINKNYSPSLSEVPLLVVSNSVLKNMAFAIYVVVLPHHIDLGGLMVIVLAARP
jgi:hypothetical protein